MSRRERPRFGPIVQATIATAMISATSASRRIQPIASRFLALAAACVAGCVTAPPPPVAPTPPPVPTLPARYAAVAWDTLPGWRDDAVEQAWPALVAGCAALVESPATAAMWKPPCAAANAVDPVDSRSARAYFESHFIPYRISTTEGKDTGLVTGYYEPLLAGSRARTSRYSVPLYAAPDDLLTIDLTSLYPDLKDRRLRGRVEGKKVVPYWPRTDIENGKAPVAGKELVFVEDPVEAFFLEIQGSGRVRLPDGSVIRIGYADQNGHPFRSIGRLLIDRGELPLERASMQGIRDWGRRNPEKLGPLLDENPSYVFFREVPPPAPGTLAAQIDGPIGTLGVPLLAERTLAADPRSIPLGTPVFLATTFPLSTRPLNRLMLAQDTGGAIRGAVRADFFWGFGETAGREAGRMRQEGRMWLLWPKDAAPPGSVAR